MDIRTTKGANLDIFERETGLSMEVSKAGQVRDKLAKLEPAVPEGYMWRLRYLARMLSEKGEAYYRSEEEEVTRLSGPIDSLCIN